MKKSLLVVLMLSFIGLSSALAQTRTISGKVTSASDGTSLPGVNIVVKGTTHGTATAPDGTYSLDVPSKGGMLIFSYLGFETVQKKIGSSNTINVQLKTSTQELKNVVVVGYGTQSKRYVTGSITSVQDSNIANTPVTSFQTALEGRTPGAFITQQSGKVGQGIRIRIRGSSSVTASNQPLYVIDGIPVTSSSQGQASNEPTNPLANLNYDDIASIQILKDASAAAIYGSRASNGVVLITTKEGKAGKTKININTSGGIGHPTHYKQFLNAKQYVTLFMEAAKNSQKIDPSFDYVGYVKNYFNQLSYNTYTDPSKQYNTLWTHQAFQTAYYKKLDVSASGGNAKTRFFTSGEYSNQKGIVLHNAYKLLSGRLNIDHQASKKLSFGAKFYLARSQNDRVSNDDQFSTPVQLDAQTPISPVYDPKTGKLNTNTLYYNGLISAKYGSDRTIVFHNLSNAFAVYNFMPSLKFRSEFGLDLINQTEEGYYGKETIGNPTGFGSYRFLRNLNYTLNNYFKYQKTLSNVHSINATVGMSYQKAIINTSDVQGEGFPNNSFKKLVSASKITSGSSTGTGFSYVSYFGRLNYKYNDTYLVSLSAREDGSSRFGVNNQYGFFPAASVGWIVTNEPFMKGLKVLSNLKLRTSYGLTGNSDIGNFDSRGLYGGTNYAGLSGIAPTQLASPDLRWETTAQLDFGMDFSLFNDRLSGTVDYYIKRTHNLLLNVNVPQTTGFSQVTKNVGKLKNTGYEVSVNYQNIKGVVSWTSGFNISGNKNVITNLGGQVIGDINRAMEGQPIGVFYMVKYAGVDPKNGDALYYVKSGSNQTTNDYNKAQRQVVGNPNPTFTGGFSNDISYKGLNLSFLFQFVYGNKIYNAAGVYQSVNGNYFDNQTADQMNRWQKPGDQTNVPQARLFMGNGNRTSSRWLYDGSYIRLKNVTLSYNLPRRFINWMSLRRLRVYVTGLNLLTFTKYPGWDPEVSASYYSNHISNIIIGRNFYTPPQARTISVGLNIGL